MYEVYKCNSNNKEVLQIDGSPSRFLKKVGSETGLKCNALFVKYTSRLARVRIKGREARQDVITSEVMCNCFTRHNKTQQIPWQVYLLRIWDFTDELKGNLALEKSREGARKVNDLHSSLLCLASYWSMLV